MARARGGGGSRSGGSRSSSRRSSGGSRSRGISRSRTYNSSRSNSYGSSPNHGYREKKKCRSYVESKHYNLGVTYSSNMFEGATKYSYMEDGEKEYIFVNGDVDNLELDSSFRTLLKSTLQLEYKTTICLIITIILAVVSIVSSLDIPHKLKLQEAHPTIYLEDNIGVLQDTEELIASAETFAKKTGLVPAVMTVDTGVWYGKWASLEFYAWEQYSKLFDDEYHILFVYSLPVGAEFEDWEWVAIYGDDSLECFSDQRVSMLERSVQDGLYKGNVGKGFTSALNKSAEDYGKVLASESTPIVAIVFGILPVILFLYLIARIAHVKKLRELEFEFIKKLTPEKPHTCEYCRGTYWIDGLTKCPHCGAPIGKYRELLNDLEANNVE